MSEILLPLINGVAIFFALERLIKHRSAYVVISSSAVLLSAFYSIYTLQLLPVLGVVVFVLVITFGRWCITQEGLDI